FCRGARARAPAQADGELAHARHDLPPSVPRRAPPRDGGRSLARRVVREDRGGDRRGRPGGGRVDLPGEEPDRRLVRARELSMDVRRKALGNGLRVAVAPIAGLRSVALLLAIEAGQWFEPAGRPGIARLTAQAMLRGTTTRDAKAWADAVDGIGAAARLDVGSHAATFSAQSLSDDLGALLEL